MEIIIDYLVSRYTTSRGWYIEVQGRVTDPLIRTKFTITKDKDHPITLQFTESEAISSLSEVSRRKLALDVRRFVYSRLQPKLQGFVDDLPNLPKPRSPEYPLNN